MKRLTIFIFLFNSLCAFSEESVKCNPAGTQQEMNVCAYEDFEKANKQLNQTYQSILKKNSDDKAFIEALKQSQKAWIVFRDKELATRFACSEADMSICWGSMYPMEYSGYKEYLTKERTEQLKFLAKDRGPDE